MGLLAAADQWAASGGMWLTGRRDGPMLPAPAPLTATLDAAAHALATATAGAGHPVRIDGSALLGERAAIAGFERHGVISCGGATRSVPAADGWLAVAPARTDDLDLLPAWLAVDAADDPWPAITATLARTRAADAVGTAVELGLAVARLGERDGDPEAVIATHLGHNPPAPRLDHLRVLDLSSLWAGPLAGQLLARPAWTSSRSSRRDGPTGRAGAGRVLRPDERGQALRRPRLHRAQRRHAAPLACCGRLTS